MMIYYKENPHSLNNDKNHSIQFFRILDRNVIFYIEFILSVINERKIKY